MHLADLNWMDVERYLEQDGRIVLVTGSTEQHGYLSLLTDVQIPMAIASAVAEQEGILVAPPLNFGCTPYFMEYPGTITLTQQTYDLVMTEIVHSLAQHGFNRFLVLNGHGGNLFPASLEALQQEADDLRIIWHNWWQTEAVKRFGQEIGAEPDHANWLENFPFTRVAEVPQTVKQMPANWDGTEITRQSLGDGSFGGAYQMPDDVMRRLYDLAVNEALALARAL